MLEGPIVGLILLILPVRGSICRVRLGGLYTPLLGSVGLKGVRTLLASA